MSDFFPPGVHDIPAARYHSDPCERPALSASLADTLLSATPLHAWTASPRLNPHFRPDEATKFDIGTAAHELLTGKGRGIREVAFDSYRSAAAQDARDKAREDGFTPLLTAQKADVEAMLECVRIQLAAHPIGNPFDRGRNEVTLIWERDGAMCRAMVDCLDAEARIAYDFKTTGGLAEPDAWVHRAMGHGTDLRAAHYLDGLDACFGPGWRYRFIVAETSDPFALSVMEFTPAALFMGAKKAQAARALWAECVRLDRWPGWPAEVAMIEPAGWHEARWLEREERESGRKPLSPDLIRAAMAWQAPERRSA